MNGKISLLDRAKRDLESCRILLERAESDELFQDLAAYHVQQAIEKALKFWLCMLDIQYPKTHDVIVLMDKLESVKQTIPDWLNENGDLINDYANKTRYSTSIVGTKRKIRELCDDAERLIKRLEPEKIENASAVNSAASNLAHQEAL
jgi:HEPN domain-containing protein